METPRSGKRSRTPATRPSTQQPSTRRAGTSSRARTRTTSRLVRTATKNGDQVVVAIIENNFSQVGICAYNLNGFDIELRQLSDSKTFSALLTTLTVLNVIEIVMSVSSSNSPLETALNAHSYTRDIKRTLISRTYFKDTEGALDVERLSVKMCPHLTRLTNSPYYLALAACGALLRYIQHANNIVFLPHSLRIRFVPNEDFLFLDMQTIEGLELLQNGRLTNQSGSERIQGSLMHAMDKTKTRAGKRLLRRSILEPPKERQSIKNRQIAVEELMQHEDIYFDMVRVLGKFPDVERALGMLSSRENKNTRHGGPSNRAGASSSGSQTSVIDQKVINETKKPCMTIIRCVLTLKAGLEAAVDLHAALRECKSPLLSMAANTIKLPVLSRLKNAIDEIITSDAEPSRDMETMRLQGAFAVKSGINGQLDVSRQVLCDIMQSMQEMRDELSERYELRDLKLALLGTRGYHLTYPTKGLAADHIPREFVKRQTSANVHRFTTYDLDSFNQRYFAVLNDIWKCTDHELEELLGVIFEPRTALALYYLCDSVAILDLVSSFVTYCSTSSVSHSRPLMTYDGPTIIVQSAHHPILLKLDPSASVPNDVFLDEAAALQIITGQNNSGKSTMLKMVGLLTIMAHSGCSIPAERATFRALDCILSRFTTSDSITEGHSHSHFSKEMTETAAILNSIKVNDDVEMEPLPSPGETIPWDPAKSHIDGVKQFLLLVDELGRSTSTLDGFSIAYAVLEEFVGTPGVFALFATHFLGLAALEKVYPNIIAYHMETHDPPTNVAPPSQRAIGFGSSQDESRTTTPSLARVPNVQSEFTYTLKEGALRKRSYGIETARAAGMQDEVTEDAARLVENMSLSRIADPEAFAAAYYKQEDIDFAHKAKGNLLVLRRIEHIKAQSKNEESMRRRLHRFQQQVIAAMNQGQSSGTQGSSSQNPPTSERSTDE